MERYSIGGVIYFLIGVFMASSRGYFADLGTIQNILSALLAIILWPLLLFGVNLNLTF
ncbi:MAG: hypothetical protein U0526_00285 [Candidatus Saccharibacteria bacterium]